MASYTVTAVSKEWSADHTHRHIAGVYTDSGSYYTRQQVVDSIRSGNSWKTYCEGYSAAIEAIGYCFRANCLAKPYIKTKPDSTKKDNLENLPEK